VQLEYSDKHFLPDKKYKCRFLSAVSRVFIWPLTICRYVCDDENKTVGACALTTFGDAAGT
jgi:hypothetical protein